ncbi:MAG: hypothetical protein EPN91_09085 [Salinibacterium sp.]|nr:MAG: hypothetical protein EPN91_09085 [Salinibacterium sp.]
MSEKKPTAESASNEESASDPSEAETAAPVQKPVETAEADASANPPAETAAAPVQQVVYVTEPRPPRKKGNRGVGSLYALLSGIVFTALLAGYEKLVDVISGRPIDFSFLADATFYIPVLFFVIGFVLLVLIVNRAAWPAYIVGSIFVAVFVYFGSIGLVLLNDGVIQNTPSEALVKYYALLQNPTIIVAALLAREVTIWAGAAIASRGRRVKARNIERRAAFDREVAETKAERERTAATA